MALRGTIQDFALPDIFQLIGIQRKTGILTLENGDDNVTIKFLDGQVVGADTRSESLEDRLGALLVRTGRITGDQLRQALRTQRNTLQRLGYLLVSAGYISEEDLVEALRLQSSQIIYRLFRWRDGTYHFNPVEDLDYDQKHFIPISSETILMEGARMIDEWPLIERRIRSARMVLRREHGVAVASDEHPGGAGFDLGFDFDRRGAGSGGEDGLSEDEQRILVLVDGRRTVQEICDLSSLGEFDTWRILSEMVTRHVVEEVRLAAMPGERRMDWGARVVSWLGGGVMILLVLLSLATLRSNPATPWRLASGTAPVDQFRYYASLSRLERIEKAIRVFYLDSGTFPKSLVVLAQNGYLRAEELEDPWGRPYGYQVSAGGYQLLGLDGSGEGRPELTVSSRFNAAQRMMLSGAPE